MDAHRMAFDVPVDHDAPAAISDVPLGHEVLVQGAEVLGIRGAGGRARPPQMAGLHDAWDTTRAFREEGTWLSGQASQRSRG